MLMLLSVTILFKPQTFSFDGFEKSKSAESRKLGFVDNMKQWKSIKKWINVVKQQLSFFIRTK